jgi:hypothetical protein
VEIRRVTQDPLIGENRYELVNIQQNEQPEELFRVPSGYEIVEPDTFSS